MWVPYYPAVPHVPSYFPPITRYEQVLENISRRENALSGSRYKLVFKYPKNRAECQYFVLLVFPPLFGICNPEPLVSRRRFFERLLRDCKSR